MKNEMVVGFRYLATQVNVVDWPRALFSENRSQGSQGDQGSQRSQGVDCNGAER